MVYDMNESASLYSATFHHAMMTSKWNEALSACRNNPSSLRKKFGLRRLVVGMVECEVLVDLLQLATNAPAGGCEAYFGVEPCEQESVASYAYNDRQ